MNNLERRKIIVNGTVQGVGFRPFIFRLASELKISGHIQNTKDGVEIEAESTSKNLTQFIGRISEEAPPLARIQEISANEIQTTGEKMFSILSSIAGSIAQSFPPPDIAPCADCMSELRDPTDRRYRYPFINCTNCGPRYSIINGLPYDRPTTTMHEFPLCPECEIEYRDSMNRRFHAQPVACDICGPELWLEIKDGERIPGSRSIDRCVDLLNRGMIVAIKGIGGFHLACDATSDEAVLKLRQRKLRDEKPFAIMVGSIESARLVCEISSIEERLLLSPERPIVILRAVESSPISKHIAPNNRNIGLMLPSSPLHNLLFDEERFLVMTSANISDEPIIFKNDEARKKLGAIADAILMHEREIVTRIDDSIARAIGDRPLIIRRARGYTPSPIRLQFEMPPILATGADLKGAICVTKGRNAILSQHLGDLEHEEASISFEDAIDHMTSLFDIKPQIIAHDMHPDYFSSRFATSNSIHAKSRIAIQHHHAHLASCMAENDLPNERVLGIILDGSGYGLDSTVWGGEILVANYEQFERAARFLPITMPGGDAASREPWRMAISQLHACGFDIDTIAKALPKISKEKIDALIQIIERKINSPLTSSCGRIFDGIAAITGIRMINRFEGQAAMELEQCCDTTSAHSPYGYTIDKSNGLLEIDLSHMITTIASDVQSKLQIGSIGARFHSTIISALVDATILAIANTGLKMNSVVLSGGCFQNEILTIGLRKRLEESGFKVYTHSLVPANDGGIALGQAAIAAHGKNSF